MGERIRTPQDSDPVEYPGVLNTVSFLMFPRKQVDLRICMRPSPSERTDRVLQKEQQTTRFAPDTENDIHKYLNVKYAEGVRVSLNFTRC